MFFKNRDATGDIDFMMEPQWAKDDEIMSPLRKAILTVARKENFDPEWMNDDLQIWASPAASEAIFQQAYTQNIVLFEGHSFKIWAAPL